MPRKINSPKRGKFEVKNPGRLVSERGGRNS
jgi:hypothetical protein